VAAQLYRLGYTGKLYLVSLQVTCGVKDPNDLNKKLFAEGCPKDFVSEYQKALASARQIDIAPKHNRPEQNGLPEIIIGGQLRELTTDALVALVSAEEKTRASLFNRACIVLYVLLVIRRKSPSC
jgi:hypothetical protein